MGDVNGRGAFTHTSYNDFEIVAANLLDNDRRRVSDRITAYALFTDPPLGRVGMTETEVRASGRPALRGVLPMTRVGRAKERGETLGFMKVLVDRETHLILGAALLCIEGDEIVHSLLDVMAAKAPYTVIQRSVHIHPTVSELIPTLLDPLAPLSWAAARCVCAAAPGPAFGGAIRRGRSLNKEHGRPAPSSATRMLRPKQHSSATPMTRRRACFVEASGGKGMRSAQVRRKLQDQSGEAALDDP